MRVTLGLCLVFILVAHGPATPASAESLKASAKWGVDFGDAHCIAYRSFDKAGEPVLLTVKAPVMGDDLQVSIHAKSKGGTVYGEQLRGTWQVDGGPPVKITALKFHPAKARDDILMMNIPRAALSPIIARSATMSLVFGKTVSHSMRIEGLGSAMKVLDDCVAGLQTDFHVTEQARANYAAQLASPNTKIPDSKPTDGSTHAKAIPVGNLFSSDDYPSDALFEGDDGVVRAVLLINDKGRVADCTLTKTSGVALLDAQTCAVVRERARYKPALDPAGLPRRDVDTYTVRWFIPDR